MISSHGNSNTLTAWMRYLCVLIFGGILPKYTFDDHLKLSSCYSHTLICYLSLLMFSCHVHDVPFSFCSVRINHLILFEKFNEYNTFYVFALLKKSRRKYCTCIIYSDSPEMLFVLSLKLNMLNKRHLNEIIKQSICKY